MKTRIKHTETYANTVYINFDLTINNKKYICYIDFSDGIQDIMIKKNSAKYDFISLYDNFNHDFNEDTRVEVLELVLNQLENKDLFKEIVI